MKVYNDQIREKWYAIFVATGQEENVKKSLEKLFVDELKFVVPKRRLKERKQGKWYEVEKKLFPGYVLIKGNIDVDTYYKIKQAPGIVRILKDYKELAIIPERELRILGLLIKDKEETISFSNILKENDNIKVLDGPLYGLEGIILSVNPRKGRAKVSLGFLGEEKVVELGINVVEKI